MFFLKLSHLFNVSCYEILLPFVRAIPGFHDVSKHSYWLHTNDSVSDFDLLATKFFLVIRAFWCCIVVVVFEVVVVLFVFAIASTSSSSSLSSSLTLSSSLSSTTLFLFLSIHKNIQPVGRVRQLYVSEKQLNTGSRKAFGLIINRLKMPVAAQLHFEI